MQGVLVSVSVAYAGASKAERVGLGFHRWGSVVIPQSSSRNRRRLRQMFGDDDEYLLCGSSDGSRCLHRVLKKLCEICAGKSRCEHGKAPSRCVACGGGGICSHGRQRSQCVECGGNGICVHRRIKSRCKECGGSGLCPHGRRRYRCHFCREEKELTAANEAPFKLREHFLGAESDAQHENTNALTRKGTSWAFPNPASLFAHTVHD